MIACSQLRPDQTNTASSVTNLFPGRDAASGHGPQTSTKAPMLLSTELHRADRLVSADKNQRICSIRDTELTSVPGIC